MHPSAIHSLEFHLLFLFFQHPLLLSISDLQVKTSWILDFHPNKSWNSKFYPGSFIATFRIKCLNFQVHFKRIWCEIPAPIPTNFTIYFWNSKHAKCFPKQKNHPSVGVVSFVFVFDLERRIGHWEIKILHYGGRPILHLPPQNKHVLCFIS